MLIPTGPRRTRHDLPTDRRMALHRVIGRNRPAAYRPSSARPSSARVSSGRAWHDGRVTPRSRGGTRDAGVGNLPGRDGRHAPGPAARGHPRPRADDPREARDAQPRRLGQGSDRDPDDRRRRAARPARPGRHDRRADLGQHRARPRDRRRDPRVPLHLRDARQDERREDRVAARLRGRGRDHPDRGRPGVLGVLLLGRGTARARDPRRLPAEPVLQPGQPRDPRADHRPRDLGADRRRDRRVRRRRRHRRHDHRRRALPQADEARDHDRRRRHRGVGVHRRRSPPLPHRGHRRGLPARHVRSEHRRPVGACARTRMRS